MHRAPRLPTSAESSQSNSFDILSLGAKDAAAHLPTAAPAATGHQRGAFAPESRPPAAGTRRTPGRTRLRERRQV